MIPYPILFCGIISISTSFASTADKTRVPAKEQIPPAKSPDGMEAARPVGLWFMTIPLSPFRCKSIQAEREKDAKSRRGKNTSAVF